MTWDSSDRRSRLPADWPQRVAAVKKRDGGRCTWRLPSGARCPRVGTDVDHRDPGDNHDLRNLQLLCEHHHAKKSSREGWAAKRKKRRGRAKNRRTEQHPGLLR